MANVCMQANAFFKLACDVDQNRQRAKGGNEPETGEKKGEEKRRGSLDGARLGVCERGMAACGKESN